MTFWKKLCCMALGIGWRGEGSPVQSTSRASEACWSRLLGDGDAGEVNSAGFLDDEHDERLGLLAGAEGVLEGLPRRAGGDLPFVEDLVRRFRLADVDADAQLVGTARPAGDFIRFAWA